MTNSKMTRKALFTSVMALILCFAMLTGTTFAWFTDQETSGNNKIIAGNLDVELEYWNGTEWKSIEAASDILTNTLYEPGATEVAYLRIRNAGNLALKYQVGINIRSEKEGVNVAGKSFKLSDYIMYGVVEDVNGETGAYATREAAVAAVTASAEKLSVAYTTADPATIEVGAEPDYLALVVYMPSDVDNVANHNGKTIPEINLGVSIIATQLAAEEDAFGKDYDDDSTYPELPAVDDAQKADGEAVTVSAGGVEIDVPAEAAAGKYALDVSDKEEVTENGATTLSLDINLTKDGAKIVAESGVVYNVAVEVGKNLEVTAVTHNGTAVSNFNYDPATGIVTFETDSFSPFTVTYKEADKDSVFVPSDSEAAEKLEKAEVVAVDENGNEFTSLTKAVKSGASKLYFKEGANLGTITHLDVTNDLVIYGNGAYISGGEHDFAIDTYAKLEKDITVTVYNLHGVAFWGQRNTEHTVNLNLYNCNNINRVYINGTSGVNNIALYNCTANIAAGSNSCSVYSNANGSITVDGCTFAGIACPINFNHKIAGEQTVTVKNSTFIDCSTEGTDAYLAPIRLYNSAEDANQTLTVAGNTFTYSEGKAPVNGADVLLNAKHNGADATGTIDAGVQINASVACGKNVDLSYLVANAEDMETLNSKISKNVKAVELVADIDMTGKTWSTVDMHADAQGVLASFEGNGHKISNLAINGAAMFSRIASAADTVKFSNITFENVTIDTTSSNAAIIAKQLYKNVVLDNVDVKGASISGETKVATLVGTVFNEGSNAITLTVKNCDISDVEITGNPEDTEEERLAGLVAWVADKFSNEAIVLENNTMTDVKINSNSTKAEHHALIYISDKSATDRYGVYHNSDEGVTLTNCSYSRKISDGLYVDGNGSYCVYNAAGLETLNAMMADKTAGRDTVVNIMADIDFTGKTWTTVDSHADTAFEIAEINGNGHTISNLTVNGQAMFKRFAGSGDVVIKDITFDKANVNSNGTINTSILTVQSYQNILLDNVDVTNSTISGGYKVAPLIATVYNEGASTVTATLKNCDVSNTVVTAKSHDFCTTGMVAFVYADDNDKIEFENCTVTNVTLVAPNDGYKAHAWVYTTGSESLYNEAEGVTVTGCTFENLQ